MLSDKDYGEPGANSDRSNQGKESEIFSKSQTQVGRRKSSHYEIIDAISFDNLPKNYLIEERYIVLEKIGQGGFGTVYRVFDKTMNIDKALKIIPEIIVNNKEAMFDLQDEAQTMISLNHPNIVRVYDYHKSGAIKFIDMEFLDGCNLSEFKLNYTGKKLPESLVKEFAVKIAEGMAYAHDNNVLHLDLKPHNIIFTSKDEIKIMDFGIAQKVRANLSRLEKSSSSGTPAYMSPEQINGSNLGKEADIYSFGATIYELLSGKPPFYKGDISYQINNKIPDILQSVSPEINAFVLKCLEKDYKFRFRNFKEVLLALGGNSSQKLADLTDIVGIDELRKSSHKRLLYRANRPFQEDLYRIEDKENNIEKIIRVLPESITENKDSLWAIRQDTQMMILDHPNIVKVFGFFQKKSTSYIEEEYIESKTLAEIKSLPQNGKFDEETVKQYALKIAEGMAYAHKRGVIHKSLNSKSIILSSEGEIKLMDFGTSSLSLIDFSDKDDESAINMRAYQSPEHINGERIDRRTDIYSFGVVLYELLNGKPPFYQGDLFGQILRAKPKPIPTVSKKMNSFIMKCLAKDPDFRFQDFCELSDHLKKMMGIADDDGEKKKDPNGGKDLEPRKRRKKNKLKSILKVSLRLLLIAVLLAAAAYGVTRLLFVHRDFIDNNLQIAIEHLKKFLYIERNNSEADSEIEDGDKLDDPRMAYVNGGTFQMGSTEGRDSERPVHNVTLSAYYISKNLVTQREWVSVMNYNPSQFVDDEMPVHNVSWYDTIVYCNKVSIKEGLMPVYTIRGTTNPNNWGDIPIMRDENWDRVRVNWNADGYRLPTEAEWEFAARGGVKSQGYVYSGSNIIDAVAWYTNNSNGRTSIVGMKRANELGIYDMSGNVWEWCWDLFGYYTPSAKTNPRGSQSGDMVVLRGGSWSDSEEFCRVTDRGRENQSRSFNTGGFRIVRVLN